MRRGTIMSREKFEEAMCSSGYSRKKPELYIKNFDGEYLNPYMEKSYRFWLQNFYAAKARSANKADPDDDRMGINDTIKPELMKKRFRDWGFE